MTTLRGADWLGRKALNCAGVQHSIITDREDVQSGLYNLPRKQMGLEKRPRDLSRRLLRFWLLQSRFAIVVLVT